MRMDKPKKAYWSPSFKGGVCLRMERERERERERGVTDSPFNYQ